MAKKSLLLVGILLLIAGIIIKKATSLDLFGLILIVSGVLCKTVYIIAKIRNGEYKPGKEFIFLGVGLLLFLSGLYLRKYDQDLTCPMILIVLGLMLKIVFIIKFVQKVKNRSLIVQKHIDQSLNR